MTVPGEQAQGLTHQPALDGLRGIAVLGVLLYHAGLPWAHGGFLGVEAFFVLSGFLITSLLATEWQRSRSIRLGNFWMRRARRLLPALIVVVIVVALRQMIGGSSVAAPDLLGSGLGTLFYAGNWQQISANNDYFATGAPSSPFQHTWSLAIEEQFYIVWPLLVMALFWVLSRRVTSSARVFGIAAAVAAAGCLASALDAFVLFNRGADVNRIYLGTDTRASGLLAGATLGLILLTRKGVPRRVVAFAATGIGIAGIGGLFVAMALVHGTSSRLYQGGMLAVDAAVVAAIAAVILLPRSPLSRLLSLPPLRAVGLISYGLYLWHFPLFLWLTTTSTGGVAGNALLALRLAATFLVSTVSYFVVEQPIRRRRVPRLAMRILVPASLPAAVAALVIASQSAQVGAAAILPPAPVSNDVAGHAAGCPVTLTDGNRDIEVPPSAADMTANPIAEPGLLHNTKTVTFHTCPPRRILVIGDSLAATLGVGLMQDEERYGTQVLLAPLLGCGFGIRGDFDLSVGWTPQPGRCIDEIATWRKDEVDFHADAVIVAMGWRDAFDRHWGNDVVHLGMPDYDAYVSERAAALRDALSQDGTPVLFLTVPWANPPARADGSVPLVASAERHNSINGIINSVATSGGPHVAALTLDTYVSPGNRYSAQVGGVVCRVSDGLHFTPACGQLLQPYILPRVRDLIAA